MNEFCFCIINYVSVSNRQIHVGLNIMIPDNGDSRDVMTKGHGIDKKHRYGLHFKQFSYKPTSFAFEAVLNVT